MFDYYDPIKCQGFADIVGNANQGSVGPILAGAGQ